MLHAWRLGITHPLTSQWIQQEAQIPNEFLPWTEKVTERLNQVRLIHDYKEFDALW
ncbi:MAG: DNA-binding transcriptional regulator YdaS (Cro superfamily) [Akkermansiaceae bacterium]|jgi:DNA-binding transcriptional regulator YdaS (Cro superfamily)